MANSILNQPGWAMAMAAGQNLGNPQGRQVDPMQAYQRSVMQRAALQQQERNNQLRQQQAQRQDEMMRLRQQQEGRAQAAFDAPAKRDIIKGADGFQYYQDTGERVLPGVEGATEAPNYTNIQQTDNGFAGINSQTGAFEPIPSEGVNFAEKPPEGAFDNEAKLRNEYIKLSQPFIKQNAAFGRINASANNPSAAGDLALIFNYMKLLDPGSTVREGEFATAQNAGGVDDTIAAQYNKILRGERLSANQRSDFVDRSKSLFSEARDQNKLTRERYSELATRNKLDPENVTIDFMTADPDFEINTGEEVAPGAGDLTEDERLELEQLRARLGR